MTNTSLFSTETQNEETTYPTPLEVLNKMIENLNQLEKDNHVIFTETKKQFDSVSLSYNEESLMNVIKEDDATSDFDEFVYEVICEWDEKFEGDTNWCDAEFENIHGDMQDSLRDFILNLLEDEGVQELSEINKDFLKRPTVIDALNDW